MTNDDSHPQSDPSFGARIDQLCDQFEAAWRDGEQPRIEEYLGNL